MNLDTLKSSILLYLNHFTMHDYVAYAWLILIFFVFILLAIFLAKKSLATSLLAFILSLVILFVAPFVLKHYLDQFLRPNQITTVAKKLNFSNTLIVSGNIKNISKKDFSLCSIHVSVISDSKNTIKNFLNALKPLTKKTILIQEGIKVNESMDFRIVFDNYLHNSDINVSAKADCY